MESRIVKSIKNLRAAWIGQLLNTIAKFVMRRFFVKYISTDYLGLDAGEYPVHNAKELLNKISECQLELHLLNEENKLNDNIEKAKQELIGSTWRKLYATYRDTKNVPKKQLDEAEKILGVSSSELNNILELCFIFRDEIDVTDWEKVCAEYRGVE